MPESHNSTATFGRKRIWRQLGDRNLWSWRFFFFTIPNYAVAYLLVNFLPTGVFEFYWLYVGFASHLVLVPIALAVRIFVPKSAFRHRLAPVMNLVLIGIAGLVRNLCEDIIEFQMGFTPEPLWVLDMSSGAFGLIYLALIYVSIFGERVRHLGVMAHLLEKRDQLLELRNTRQQSLQKHEQSLRLAAQELILPRLHEFETILEEKTPVQDQVEYLRSTLLNTVRPLAQQLQDRRSVNYFEDFSSKAGAVRSLEFFKRLDLVRDVRPFMVLAAFFPGYANGAILIAGLGPFLSGLVYVPIAFASLYVVRLIGAWVKFKGTIIKTAIFVGLPAIGLITMSYLQTRLVESDLVRLAVLVAELWGFGLIYVGTAFVTALSAHQRQMEREVADYNAALQSEWEIYQRDFWVENKRWSYILHGEVQAALTTAIARLTMRPIVTRLDIDEVRQDLARVVQSLSKPTNASINLKEAMDELVEVWRGVVEITYSGSKEAVDLLESDEFAKQCIAEICKEAISNAYRHGQARSVTIHLEIKASRFALTITNDGLAPSVKASKGIGSKMLDDLAPRWSLTRKEGVTTLQALVPSSALN
jgi:signal transduction histidine kinase